MQILGASTDSVEANASFAEKNGFTFPLLCDTERELCTAYGACEGPEDRAARRITYVIGPDGAIEQAHATVNAREHAEALLRTL